MLTFLKKKSNSKLKNVKSSKRSFKDLKLNFPTFFTSKTNSNLKLKKLKKLRNLKLDFSGDDLGAIFVSLDDILEQSDFIINAVPLNNETRGMFNEAAFNKMKKSSIFVNIGRGQTVVTESLVKALKEGKIFAAGLDVTDPEPLPTDHELLRLPNAGTFLPSKKFL